MYKSKRYYDPLLTRWFSQVMLYHNNGEVNNSVTHTSELNAEQ